MRESAGKAAHSALGSESTAATRSPRCGPTSRPSGTLSATESSRAEHVTVGSARRVWWQCSRDLLHVWPAAINNRTRLGSGCPFCAGKVATLATSLLVRFPGIALEWHPEKNGRLTPAEVMPGSSLKAWWRCRVDPSHEWTAEVCGRTSRRTPSGCPHCLRLSRGITLPQSSLATAYPELAREWHPKNGALTPDSVTWGSGRKVWWRCKLNPAHAWCAVVAARSRDPRCPECCRAAKTLAARRPDLVDEWHPTKNGRLGPDDVLAGSHKKVWWRCRANRAHVWKTAVCHRTVPVNATGCPRCPRPPRTPSRAASLAAVHRELAREWHPTRNGALTPATVFPRSGKKVWWRCRLNPAHEWLACVAHRSGGSGCPYCYQAANVRRSRRGTERVARDGGALARPRSTESRDRPRARGRPAAGLDRPIVGARLRAPGSSTPGGCEPERSGQCVQVRRADPAERHQDP